MNPSAAAGNVDDTTIRLLWRFAQRLDYCNLTMLNAYAYRATNPSDLHSSDIDPVGEDNDEWMRTETAMAEFILACWGVIDSQRDGALRDILEGRGAMCLGLTAGGFPRHPLRTRLDETALAVLPCG